MLNIPNDGGIYHKNQPVQFSSVSTNTVKHEEGFDVVEDVTVSGRQRHSEHQNEIEEGQGKDCES
jgi:hypothetical protein